MTSVQPRCIFGCEVARYLLEIPGGCHCFADERQWRCDQHALRFWDHDDDGSYRVVVDLA